MKVAIRFIRGRRTHILGLLSLIIFASKSESAIWKIFLVRSKFISPCRVKIDIKILPLHILRTFVVTFASIHLMIQKYSIGSCFISAGRSFGHIFYTINSRWLFRHFVYMSILLRLRFFREKSPDERTNFTHLCFRSHQILFYDI